MWYPTQCWFWRPIISPDSTWPAMFQVVQFMTTTQCLGCGSCTCVWIFCAASKVLNKSQSIPKALFVLLILFWLVVWNMAFVFHNLISGMLSFPLTFIFFKMIIAPPTSVRCVPCVFQTSAWQDLVGRAFGSPCGSSRRGSGNTTWGANWVGDVEGPMMQNMGWSSLSFWIFWFRLWKIFYDII